MSEHHLEDTRSLIGKEIYRPPYMGPIFDRTVLRSKIVMLNKPNLEILEGYKAHLELLDNGEVVITITGQKLEFARRMYFKIKEMQPEEIYGDNE